MIHKVHERAPRVVLNDLTSDFKTLLQKKMANIFKIRKTENGILQLWDQCLEGEIPLTTSEIFKSLRQKKTERERAVYFGLETLSYCSPQLWSLLPEYMR